MRKYRLWPRHSQVGTNAYAVLYGRPAEPSRRLSLVGAPPRTTARSRCRAKAAVRRRRVLTVLLSALAVPALVALATGWAAAWWVVLGLLPLVCAYLAVLFRTRRLMAEREINVAFFGAADRTDATLEELFPDRFAHSGDELGAVSAGRY